MKEATEKPPISLMGKTIGLYVGATKKYPGLAFGYLVLTTLFTFTQDIAAPFLLAELIDGLINVQNNDYQAVYTTFWLIVAVLIANFIFGRITFVFRNPMYLKVIKDLSMSVFGAFERQEYSFYANSFVGSLVARANRFVGTYKDLADSFYFQLIPLLLQFTLPIIILSRRSPQLGLLFALSGVVILTATILLGRIKRPYMTRAAASDSAVTGALADALTNNLAIKVFAHRKYESGIFEKVNETRRQLFDKQMTVDERIRMVRAGLIIIFQIAVAYVLIRLTQQQEISVGTILLVQLYLVNLISSLWVMNRISERMEQALADAAEMTEVILREPKVQDKPGAVKLHAQNGAITFDGVQFTYHEESSQSDALFNNLSLEIPAGQKVGLVGPSGGGKTTLTKILLRFMDIDRGHIKIDGQDIADVKQDDLRRAITYVPQEPLLFHRTVRENIAYGDPSATEAEIKEAARLAHADEFIEQLSEGYDTLVGERGVKLSGGEKQRVAIARAMLKKAPILVLDEATSALDSKSEKAIVSALDNLMQNRTTVVIAHRLSTIRKLDRVLVLKNGEIVEDGSHQSLLGKKEGVYAELWHHQSGEFLREE